MFTISKQDGFLSCLADLRELNKCLRRHPYPIPKIQGMLYKLKEFVYATSLDLNMGYYHISLAPNASRLCMVVLPWSRYIYLKLPIKLCYGLDIFQVK